MSSGSHITESEEVTWPRRRASGREVHDAEMQPGDLLDSFISNLPGLGWIKDDLGRYVYVNPEFQQLAARKGVNCLGRTDHDLWPRDLADRLRAADEKSLRASDDGNSTEILPAAEGDRKVRIHRFSFRAKSGKTYIGGIALNVSDVPASGTAESWSKRLFQCGLIGIMECSGDTVVAANDTLLGWL